MWFGCHYRVHLTQWKSSPDCRRVTNSERTRQTLRADIQETSAIMFGSKRFHLNIYGRHFTILSDSSPLSGNHASLTLDHYTVNIQLQHQFLSNFIKMQWLIRYHNCPCPPRLTKRMLLIEWKNVWFTRYPLRTRR